MRIMESSLQVAGEYGYRGATVRLVLRSYGGYRTQFYRYFSSYSACYEQAYSVEVKRLCDLLLAAGRRHGSFPAGFEAALCALANFASEQPDIARGLLVEVHGAGESPLRKRREVIERLSRAIDSARRKTESRHSPPPLTAPFIVHVIDAAIADALLRGAPERFSPTELTELAAAYFDPAENAPE